MEKIKFEQHGNGLALPTCLRSLFQASRTKTHTHTHTHTHNPTLQYSQ